MRVAPASISRRNSTKLLGVFVCASHATPCQPTSCQHALSMRANRRRVQRPSPPPKCSGCTTEGSRLYAGPGGARALVDDALVRGVELLYQCRHSLGDRLQPPLQHTTCGECTSSHHHL
jgi:hypothetical protein